MKINNARIKSAELYIEDHDILTFSINLDLGGGHCSIGGYSLDHSCKVYTKGDKDYHYERIGSPAGLECMRKIMELVGVSKWSDLSGKYIRFEDNGAGTTITKIGHILNDKWFDIKEFFQTYNYEDWYSKFQASIKQMEW